MLGRLIIQSAKVITVSLILALCSCKPETLDYSVVPEISLISVTQIKNAAQKDSIIQVTISYQDGDGDIGLTDADTLAPYNIGSPYAHNLPITYMVPDENGGYTELLKSNNGQPYGNEHERIPIITPTGKYKAINGEIVVNLSANPAFEKPAEVCFEIRLIDRNLNISNTITTEVLQLTH
ncbi:hypothetical protein N9811_01475 [Bacteroidia bacterium]|nr:hypothetical protein [Bacteroidia bacterium]